MPNIIMKTDTKRKKSKKQPNFKVSETIEKYFPKTSHMGTSPPSHWEWGQVKPIASTQSMKFPL